MDGFSELEEAFFREGERMSAEAESTEAYTAQQDDYYASYAISIEVAAA